MIVRPDGIGKTMILENVALHALTRGHTVRFVTASDMLAELAGLDAARATRVCGLPATVLS